MNRPVTSTRLDRRGLIALAPAALGTFLLDPQRLQAAAPPGEAAESGTSSTLPPGYPAQEAEAVREVVGASHGNFERVRELVDERPELAKAAWDWGFGDWESALGAASHTGSREIAEYLIAQGARPNLFTAAMLGDLPTVQAFLAAVPGIESQPGPHGLTLLLHARLGGEPAREVYAYLEELGTADPRPATVELPFDQAAYLGTYAFGSGPDDHFEVIEGSRGGMMLRRSEGTPRGLTHIGESRFLPAGAPSAEIRFTVDGERVQALEIHNPRPVVRAVKSAAD